MKYREGKLKRALKRGSKEPEIKMSKIVVAPKDPVR